MTTLTERYEELWKQFIEEEWLTKNTFCKRDILQLLQKFEKWLFKKSEFLGIAG